MRDRRRKTANAIKDAVSEIDATEEAEKRKLWSIENQGEGLIKLGCVSWKALRERILDH
jgi:hypothetical protein